MSGLINGFELAELIEFCRWLVFGASDPSGEHTVCVLIIVVPLTVREQQWVSSGWRVIGGLVIDGDQSCAGVGASFGGGQQGADDGWQGDRNAVINEDSDINTAAFQAGLPWDIKGGAPVDSDFGA